MINDKLGKYLQLITKKRLISVAYKELLQINMKNGGEGTDASREGEQMALKHD